MRLLAAEGRLEAGAAPRAPGCRDPPGRPRGRRPPARPPLRGGQRGARGGRGDRPRVLPRRPRPASEACDAGAGDRGARARRSAARIVSDAAAAAATRSRTRSCARPSTRSSRRRAARAAARPDRRRARGAPRRGPGDDLGELAHHFLEAAPAGDPRRPPTTPRTAAGQATEQLAYEDAVDLLRAGAGRAGARARLGARAAARDRARARARRRPAPRATTTRARRSRTPPRSPARSATREALRPRRVRCRRARRGGQLRPRDRRAGRGGARGRRGGGGEPALAAPARARLGVYWEDPAGQGRAAQRRGARDGAADRRRRGARAARSSAASSSPATTPRARGSGWPRQTRCSSSAARTGDLELELRAHAYRLRAYLELGDIAGVDRELAAFERARRPSCASPSTSGTCPLLQAHAGADRRALRGRRARSAARRSPPASARRSRSPSSSTRSRPRSGCALQGRDGRAPPMRSPRLADALPGDPGLALRARLDRRAGRETSSEAREEFERLAARRLRQPALRRSVGRSRSPCSPTPPPSSATPSAPPRLYELLAPYDGLNRRRRPGGVQLRAGRAASSACSRGRWAAPTRRRAPLTRPRSR